MNLPDTSAASGGSLAPAPPLPTESNVLVGKIALGLALATFLIFLPVVSMNWVNYDDDIFVTNNPNVAPGFTWKGVYWALTSADIDYWRPVSWLSHMLDTELFGSVAGYHHLSNLLIHIAATVMLFLALHQLTKEAWPSAMVAALFAWHPLHVESVAWIAERKDVLCGFFWFFTMWAYAVYVRRPSGINYLRVLLGFLLGVMSKPMIVTLPCVLLLLDWWPLNRLVEARDLKSKLTIVGRLLMEKLPLFGMVALLGISTVYSQHQVGTMSDFSSLPISYRIPNAISAYGTYLGQMLLPAHLCVLYPRSVEVPLWRWLPSSLILLLLSGVCLSHARKFPFLPVGWFWFLGVLVPVIGIIQVGEQAHADRYTYIPLVGVFLVVIWLGASVARRVPHASRCLAIVAGIVLMLCAVATRVQLRHWEDSIALMTRAARVTEENVTAMNNVAAELRSIKRYREAVQWLELGLRIRPTQGSMFNLGLSYSDLGDSLRAQFYVAQAFRMDSTGKTAREMYEVLEIMAQASQTNANRWHLAAIGAQSLGNHAGAATNLAQVIRLEPENVPAHIDRAANLAQLGQDAEAIRLLESALRLSPTNAIARGNLAPLLARQGRTEEALTNYEALLKNAPDNPDLRHNYALLLSRTGRLTMAREEFRRVLKLRPNHSPALQQLSWLLSTRAELRDASESLRLAKHAATLIPQPTPMLMDVLAAANAAAGQFDEALKHINEAIRLARTANQPELADQMRNRLSEYSARRPYTVN